MSDLLDMKKDLLLIQGALSTAQFWHQQSAFLGHRAFCNYSPVLTAPSIQKMAEQVIDHCPQKFTLVGFSQGGHVAIELMQHIPERIERLILMNSSAQKLAQNAIEERYRALRLLERGKFELLVRFLFERSFFCKHHYRAAMPFLSRMAMEVGERNYKNQLIAMITKPDQTEQLKSIRCPTLILASREDSIVPAYHAKHLFKHIPDAKLIYIEQSSHLVPIEKAHAINRILVDWLNL